MIEVADFDAIRKKHAVAQPIETIRQDDLALCPARYSVKVDVGDDFVAITQVDLALMRVSESVGLPKCHGSIIA